MVVPDLGILDEALLVDAEAVAHKASRELPKGSAGKGGKATRQRGDDVGGDISAVGTRIGDEPVPLIEPLQRVEGLLGAEVEQDVRIPLQFGEVVGKRRRLRAVGALDRGDDPLRGDEGALQTLRHFF